jgi:hypothetical protein
VSYEFIQTRHLLHKNYCYTFVDQNHLVDGVLEAAKIARPATAVVTAATAVLVLGICSGGDAMDSTSSILCDAI